MTGHDDVLVVYATKTGCTADIARRIAEVLGRAGATVTVTSASEAPAPAGFSGVVVGSGVRAGQWHASAREWVERNAQQLRNIPVAFFTCGMMITQGEGKRDEVAAYSAPVSEAAGLEPVDLGLFAGWYEPKKFPFAERTILKLMKTPQGDFRDWDAIDAWADRVSGQLRSAS